ncbi:MAG: glycogen debranching protein GlgX [Pirellulaceae bacterium]|nr:glycogen debranching protein GlgX [Pirellulaceae bacterium]
MLMRHPHPELQFTYSLPYGAIATERGVQFVVFSRSATAMRVLLYDKVEDREPVEIIELDRDTDRWGDVWSVFVPGLNPGQLYHFQASGPYDPESGQWFDGQARLIDPYAKALAGCFQPSTDGIIRPPKCVVIDDYFDWEGDRHLRRPLTDTVIYETHVRGFTQHESSGVKYRGTYLGLIEKIPYLQDLGVTAVELMPIHEFPIRDIHGNQPDQPNYWGYDPMAFFAPHRGYAHSDVPGAQVTEFKQTVKALHRAGIEVILDVVFNHTCEGNQHGPILSFKGLENQVYYILNSGGSHYSNYSGCGNTFNGNHPICRELIFHCLRHWVHNYHVDGFRFDLASILSRDRFGNLTPNPPMVEFIAEDPMLADTKIIAEAWDAAGAYQVGSFGDRRWAEWNGHYRDDVRRYWRGDPGMIGAMATRLAGSSDLYEHAGRAPYCSINFVTSHDGFTLNDLVSYKDKHNLANGENNRDGDNNNCSDNYGVEGPSRRKAVETLRVRQIKNMLATLLMSQGVPMIVMGDEVRRTQHGNNNAYCQDNEISWFNWSFVKRHQHIRNFVKGLIKLRKNQPTLRRQRFLTGRPFDGRGIPDVNWFNHQGLPFNWEHPNGGLVCWLPAPAAADDPQGKARDLLFLFNGTAETLTFRLPEQTRQLRWSLLFDTTADSPLDIFPDMDGPPAPANRQVELVYRSLMAFVAEPHA